MEKSLLKAAELECDKIAGHLFTFLKNEEVRERLRTWREHEAPDIKVEDFEVTKFEADELIMAKIKTEIRNWETQQGHVKIASEKLTKLFIDKCDILGREADEVQLILQGDPMDNSLFGKGQLLKISFSFFVLISKCANFVGTCNIHVFAKKRCVYYHLFRENG